jgi:hypothetical protein
MHYVNTMWRCRLIVVFVLMQFNLFGQTDEDSLFFVRYASPYHSIVNEEWIDFPNLAEFAGDTSKFKTTFQNRLVEVRDTIHQVDRANKDNMVEEGRLVSTSITRYWIDASSRIYRKEFIPDENEQRNVKTEVYYGPAGRLSLIIKSNLELNTIDTIRFDNTFQNTQI